MQEIKEPNKSPQRKPLIFYYLACLCVLMLLNALFFPAMTGRSVTEVGYNAFLDMIDQGLVRQVAYNEAESQYVFIAEQNGNAAVFKTGVWPGDGERLLSQLRENPDIVFSASMIPSYWSDGIGRGTVYCPYSGCFGFDSTAFILIIFLQCSALHLHLRAIVLSVFQLCIQVRDRELDFGSGLLDGFHLFVIQIGVLRQQMLCCAIELR